MPEWFDGLWTFIAAIAVVAFGLGLVVGAWLL